MPTKYIHQSGAHYEPEMLSFPPMTSKYAPPTSLEVRAQRDSDEREKARLRMARRRAELKSRPLAEQAAAAARERKYHAVYRAKHREKLRSLEAQRRHDIYAAKHGPDVLEAYLSAQRDRRRQRIAKYMETRVRKRG